MLSRQGADSHPTHSPQNLTPIHVIKTRRRFASNPLPSKPDSLLTLPLKEKKQPINSMAISSSLSRFLLLLILVLGPVIISVILYQPPGFDPALFPDEYSFGPSISPPHRRDGLLGASERLGDGLLLGPEDLAYDAEAGFLYTGCHDGWIRRVRLAGEGAVVVEDWVQVGGRPLGIAFGPDGSLVVADAHKGLMMVKADKSVELLIDEAEGLKFGLTDGVDVASDSMIYFTDASYKYNLGMHMLDFLGGRPHGRLISFDPSTNQTTVLLQDLYFANGVSLSPDQRSLIFCETPLRSCKRYHIQGEKVGMVEKFIENLPGFPDNIRYDGDNHYWIALTTGRTLSWDMLFKYPFLRKLMVFLAKFVNLPHMRGNAGVLSVNLEGQPLSLYSDPRLHLVTSGLKIGEHLYYGSLDQEYIGRINLKEDITYTF